MTLGVTNDVKLKSNKELINPCVAVRTSAGGACGGGACGGGDCGGGAWPGGGPGWGCAYWAVASGGGGLARPCPAACPGQPWPGPCSVNGASCAPGAPAAPGLGEA